MTPPAGRGFTLTELTVSAGLMIALAGGLGGWWRNVVRWVQHVSDRTAVLYEDRLARAALAADLRRATGLDASDPDRLVIYTVSAGSGPGLEYSLQSDRLVRSERPSGSSLCVSRSLSTFSCQDDGTGGVLVRASLERGAARRHFAVSAGAAIALPPGPPGKGGGKGRGKP